MASTRLFAHMSTKGQVVIPAVLRRQLGLRVGQKLAVRSGERGELIFEPVQLSDREARAMLERARDWVAASGRDLVAELHERRAREREVEARKYADRRR